MFRHMLAAAAIAAAVSGTAAYAQKADFGTPAEAKAMLEKVVAGMKADKAQTLTQISKGEFKDRDLYPYCVGPDGKYAAHPDASRIGQPISSRKYEASFSASGVPDCTS